MKRTDPDKSQNADLVWFDPGVTTGMATMSLDPRWLDGMGTTDFVSIGKAVIASWFGQCGRHARLFDDTKGRAYTPEREMAVTKHNPGSQHRIEPTLSGEGIGGDITTAQANEIRQLIQMQNLLEAWPGAAWGYEDFVPRQLNQGREFLAPVRLFSSLTANEILHGTAKRVPFIQNASMAKSTATDERLKDAGLYRAGMLHATDAARHCLTFYRRARADKELRQQAWPHLFS